MDKKGLSEIRRRFQFGVGNFSNVYGCYVNNQKEVSAEFDEYLGNLIESNTNQILGMFKKCLSGKEGKTLFPLEFTTDAVMQKEPGYELLETVRECRLDNAAVRERLYHKIANTLELGTPYLIALAYEDYDVPTKSESVDGDTYETESESVFRYFVCSICPIKTTKEFLEYALGGPKLVNGGNELSVSAPVMGFMYPTFEDRSANIYSLLYYNKNLDDNNPDFTQAMFGLTPGLAANEQKESFESILSETLQEECTMDLVLSLQNVGTAEDGKEVSDTITCAQITDTMEDMGVTLDKVNAFTDAYRDRFGEAALQPDNLFDAKKICIETSYAKLVVNPEYQPMVTTKVIDGRTYVLLQADGSLKVNGIYASAGEKD